MCVFCFVRSSLFAADVQNKHIESDVTVLIDLEKYQQLINARRHPRNARSVNHTKSAICADLEREEYQKCGNKCVLGCRYDAWITENNTMTASCNATECIEGCFCKSGFVRYHKKCVLPTAECPTRESKSVGMIYENPTYPSRLFGLLRPCGPYGCKPCMNRLNHYEKDTIRILTPYRFVQAVARAAVAVVAAAVKRSVQSKLTTVAMASYMWDLTVVVAALMTTTITTITITTTT